MAEVDLSAAIEEEARQVQSAAGSEVSMGGGGLGEEGSVISALTYKAREMVPRAPLPAYRANAASS